MRQPPMPPVAVAKAASNREFYHNVSIQEIYGAPEFRWFDGGQVLTTFPTRQHVLRSFMGDLERADMLAPSRLDSEYMLYVQFEDIHGPDRWLGSDKLASAKITFRLVRWRTNEVVRVFKFDAGYRAKWAGITPDEVRAAIAGPIGVTRESAIAPVGGLIGGLALGYVVNENLVAKIADVPLAAAFGGHQAEAIALLGDYESQATSSPPNQYQGGFLQALAPALAIASARGHFTNLEAMLAGGLISASGAAAGPVTVSRPTAFDEEIGAFDGTKRRQAATQGLLGLAFDEFMLDLSHDGTVVYKKAVSCGALNPTGYRVAFLTETNEAYAINCPGAEYNYSKTSRVYPNKF